METKNVSTEKKGSILNSLAIAGFIGIVLILAWLSVQLVQLFPTAFTSLASLAEGVNQSAENLVDQDSQVAALVLTSNTSLINNGEDVTINWSKANSAGSYVFAYECIEGVSLTQTDAVTERSLSCDTNYNVGDINTLSLQVESEKNRYVDIPFSVSFLKSNDTRPRAAGSDVVTVINDDINGFATIEPTNTTDLTLTEEVAGPEAVVETPATPVATNPNTNTPATVGTPTYEYEYVYEIPTSNPSGFTDLGASFVAVGNINGNQFTPATINIEADGAIQFSVQNFGTKTSRDWTFSVEMPNGSTYESKTQAALKPNEEAVLTIGFRSGDQNPHTFEVSVEESADTNSQNDSFRQTVGFVE